MIGLMVANCMVFGDRLTVDLIFTVAASGGVIGISALALALMPQNDAEVIALSTALTPRWWRR